MEVDGEAFYLKPMNCPHHHMIYQARPRSYRELPLRLAEYGMCYRYEQSGELSGLLRVRALCINDAHIYCRADQSRQEFVDVMRLHFAYYRLFNIEPHSLRLSLPDLEPGGKYAVDTSIWQEAEKIILAALEELNVDFDTERGEAAFYGPKVDVQIRNVVGREETASTNQLDLVMAERFNLTYVGQDNHPHHPHILHRAPLGSHERFIAFLIEHYGGLFPTWLAPQQVRVLPVNEDCLEYARQVHQALRRERIRSALDLSHETLGKKLRLALQDKVPNFFIVGAKERDTQQVCWRRHGEKAQRSLPLEKTVDELRREISQRQDWRLPAA